MLFVPLSKALARAMGPGNVNHAIAIALFVTFIVTGIWHGSGLNFLLIGALHGAAMVLHHYYTIFLRGRLSREQLKRYQQNEALRVAGIALTFSFVTATFFVFANDTTALKRLLCPHIAARGGGP
jgi:D-alanyl-lipoteichoic acid acyltransferase DltB (MBOAT superfamily)